MKNFRRLTAQLASHPSNNTGRRQGPEHMSGRHRTSFVYRSSLQILVAFDRIADR